MRSSLFFTLSLVLALGIVFLSAAEAEAIPAFARKYETSCSTCHSAFPRLNGTGEAYRLNGFKFVDDEAYRKKEPVELGDEAYKRVWPKAIWPSDIPGFPPISAYFESQLEIDAGGDREVSTDFLFPSTAEILGAGALGDSASMFVEVGFSNGGGGHGHGDEGGDAGTEVDVEGWLQFEDLLGSDNGFNVRLGTVGMQEMGLFTARDHNRLTVNPYLYSTWGLPGFEHHEDEGHDEGGDDHGDGEDEEEHHESEAEAIGFAGNPFIIHAQPGIEVNGFGARWRYAFGVTTGNSESVRDNNSEKDVYLQLAWKVGGRGFDGSGVGEGKALESAEPWRDDSFVFSVFGYYGTGTVVTTYDHGPQVDDDKFWRVGPGFLWKRGDFALGGGYMAGSNDNPYGELTGLSVDSKSWFVEAYHFVFPWLIPYVRYEALDLDLPFGIEGLPADVDRSRLIVSAKMLLRANISCTVEGRFHTKDERFRNSDTDNLVSFALVAAF